MREDYVSFKIAKLLRKKGFDNMVNSCYGTAVKHNGHDIDEDEEYELKAEGRGKEIRYVAGGMIYNFWNNNSSNTQTVYSRPTLALTMKWLREKNCFIVTEPIIYQGKVKYYSTVKFLSNHGSFVDGMNFMEKTYEKACEKAIRYGLEEVI